MAGTLTDRRAGIAEASDPIIDALESLRSVPFAPHEEEPPRGHQRRLDDLVTSIAVGLMSVSRSSFGEAVAWTLRTLGEFFQVDTVYLRRNHLDEGVSVLVDEWPRREDVPDPDPLGVVPFDADPVFAAIRDLRDPFLIRPRTSPDEYQERVKEGSGIPEVSMAMVPLVHDDITEGVLGFVHFQDRAWENAEINALQAIASLIMQLQARIDAEERLHHNAFHDALTGLSNRRALVAELEQRLAGTPGETVAVLFLDIDHFKAMNDALGHRAGDQVLIETAQRIKVSLTPGDLATRPGGDEFVVVMGASASSADAYQVGARMLELIARPIELDGQCVTRTASLGVAVGEVGRATADELLAQADAALYVAKGRGRNQIVMFDDELRAAVDDRFDLEISLRRAIDDGNMLLYYQPEFDLRTGEMLAVEALVRWDHPHRGVLPASAFISVAEETGLIVDLGRWVLEEACRQMAVWLERHPELRLTMRVNVSPAQLLSPTLAQLVEKHLSDYGIPGRVLCLEITEHAVIQDVERSVRELGSLRALGVQLAIDDFGCGQSSMAQLKRLPVNSLKIDQSFVASIDTDPTDQAIVDSIIRLGNALGLELIAEGVERPTQAQELLALGCRRAQGFLYSRAVPAEHVEHMIIGREGAVPAQKAG